MEQEQVKDKRIESLETQVKELERLASLGTLSAGIAHEIQNPLNFVINFSKMSHQLLAELNEVIENVNKNLTREDREDFNDILSGLHENMDKITEHGNRAISIIRGILLYSRGKEGEFVPTQVGQLVKEYVWLAYHAMRANYKNFNIAIHEEYGKDIPSIKVIPQDFSRAVLNVMNNACYAVWQRQQEAPADYQPAISVKVDYDGASLSLAIEDNGEGMSGEVKQKLFENFFTTKPSGQGTGLGMSIVRDIIENKHHGKVSFDSEKDRFTRFTFTIPAQL